MVASALHARERAEALLQRLHRERLSLLKGLQLPEELLADLAQLAELGRRQLLVGLDLLQHLGVLGLRLLQLVEDMLELLDQLRVGALLDPESRRRSEPDLRLDLLVLGLEYQGGMDPLSVVVWSSPTGYSLGRPMRIMGENAWLRRGLTPRGGRPPAAQKPQKDVVDDAGGEESHPPEHRLPVHLRQESGGGGRSRQGDEHPTGHDEGRPVAGRAPQTDEGQINEDERV